MKISSGLKRLQEYIRLQKVHRIESARPIENDFFGKTMCLFSSPRGGSTWLLEMLMKSCDFTPVNEPFFQGKFRTDRVMPTLFKGRPYLKKLNYWYYQPLPEDYESEVDKEIFKEIFSGKYLNPILTPYSSINELKRAEKLLVKFCYGNLMLPWIVKNFNLSAIFMMRHPCAVVASQLNVVGAFDHVTRHPEFVLPTFTNSYYFDEFEPILKKISTPEESLAAIWAITIGYVINHPLNNICWHSLKYEDLLSDPLNELEKIRARFPEFVWKERVVFDEIVKPSKTTLDKDLKAHLLNNTQEDKWRDQLSSKQMNNIMSIVKEFGVEVYE